MTEKTEKPQNDSPQNEKLKVTKEGGDEDIRVGQSAVFKPDENGRLSF